jgi:hypothetical protein
MADEKNKKPLKMEELRTKVDKIAAIVLPALHPNLQRIVDEQQPMSMDVLPALHPDLQRVFNEQLASLMLTPQQVDMLELLPLPPPILLEQDLIQDRGGAVRTAASTAPCSGRCADCSTTGAATVCVISTSYEGQHVCPHHGDWRQSRG